MPTERRRNIARKRKRRRKRKLVEHEIMEIEDSFLDLKSILKEGLRPRYFPNVFRTTSDRKMEMIEAFPSKFAETYGDKYGVKILTKVERLPHMKGKPPEELEEFSARNVAPEHIKRIFVEINKGLSAQEIANRMKFYRRELKGFRIPIEFV